MTKPTRATTHDDYTQRMLRVLVHIQQHLDADLALEDLAAIAHFSPWHFHRIFTGMVGESVKQHVRRLRLERAAMQLMHTERSVTDIAFDAGYEAHEAFTRAFRQAFDQSPSGFRESVREAVCIDAPSGVHYREDRSPPEFKPVSEGSTVDVEIKRIEPIHAAFMRHVGPYRGVGETWQKMVAFAMSKGLFGPQTKVFGMAYDDPRITPEDKLRYDVCISVPEDFEPSGEVGVQTAAGREYAVATHVGPYEKLEDTYLALIGEWFPQSGREPASAPCMEIYLNDPRMTPPEELRTELCVPIEA